MASASNYLKPASHKFEVINGGHNLPMTTEQVSSYLNIKQFADLMYYVQRTYKQRVFEVISVTQGDEPIVEFKLTNNSYHKLKLC